ncbi:M1 family metallopeptidase [soil metagenome]
MARRDPHSYADDAQLQTESFALRAQIDFATRIITADVTLQFRTPGRGQLDLDTRELSIESIADASGHALAFTVHPPDPYIGARLEVMLAEVTPSITIRYRTSPDASALQWLAPAQTNGGVHPYLFSQCQAIHARSLVPVQDTPALRQRYTAELTIPSSLRAVMAAADRGRTEAGELATHRFEMPQPIPPYLFAFAIGDLASRELSPRVRVWAEPGVVEKAAWEFAGAEAMITAAEALFGPYDWERFDILTMPPSFPYGGMENPRLTFITPTVIAGDRSLVSVIAHELAHSWTGNLVTNANAEHFWLNEGFTMYAERRITEALEGEEIAALSAALGRRELDESIERFAATPAMTKLRTHLEGIDPDECYSLIPYEKGYLFLTAIEAAVGRPAFVAWLRTYLETFRFGAITTEDFVQHIERGLPGALAQVNAPAWLDGEGLPANAVTAKSSRLAAIEALGTQPPPADNKWSATEWALYLENLPRPPAVALPEATLRALDAQFHLTESGNYDVLVPWLTLALKSGYLAVLPRVERVVAEVGRMKYLRPLYTALAAEPATRDRGNALFDELRAGYHPIARQMVEGVQARYRPAP